MATKKVKKSLVSSFLCLLTPDIVPQFIEVSNFKGKYVFGSLATYHCNPGYILWGNASRLCTEVGTWTGLRPQCKPITCGQPPEVSNTRFHLINGTTSWQSLAKYTCKPGHSMVYEKRKF